MNMAKDTGNYGNTGGNPGNPGQENPRGHKPGQPEQPGQGGKKQGDVRNQSEWERERGRKQDPDDPNRPMSDKGGLPLPDPDEEL
jgi:hypothetical protein